jgi:hypothetical protein
VGPGMGLSISNVSSVREEKAVTQLGHVEAASRVAWTALVTTICAINVRLVTRQLRSLSS